MATKIQLRRDTEANWTSNNPILASGEIGISTDKSNFKIGDGTSAWKILKYMLLPLGTIEEGSIAIGANAEGLDIGIAIGESARGESFGVSMGVESLSMNGGIAIGHKAKSEDEAINIGAHNITVPENHIQIGTANHEALKIPAVAGATDGMTLKVNTDGTIYAE